MSEPDAEYETWVFGIAFVLFSVFFMYSLGYMEFQRDLAFTLQEFLLYGFFFLVLMFFVFSLYSRVNDRVVPKKIYVYVLLALLLSTWFMQCGMYTVEVEQLNKSYSACYVHDVCTNQTNNELLYSKVCGEQEPRSVVYCTANGSCRNLS